MASKIEATDAVFPVALNIDPRLPRAQQVYAALKEAILDLRLPPGTPVGENAICQQTIVSRTPVREALIRLAQEDLIAVYPQQGSFVAPIRLQKVIEGSFVRESLELSILRLASERWSNANTEETEAILARQRACATRKDQRAFFREDENFHTHFAEVAGMSGVVQVIQDATTHVVRVRRLGVPVAGHMERVVSEHQAVLDNLKAKDTTQAAASLKLHLSRVYNAVVRLSERHPDYFDVSGVSIRQALERH
jgi:DNA-binding GntR family transcriptional regulator